MLRLHCNGSNSFLFVNAVKMYQFKENDSEARLYPLCLGDISKDFTLGNMKKKKKKTTHPPLKKKKKKPPSPH